MPLKIAQVLDRRYRIDSLLGQGGFGAVYKAWDLSLDRACAVKENLDTSEVARRQFTREATVLARRIDFLNHCRPKMSSRPPTTTRNAPSGRAVNAGPNAATISAKTAKLQPTPMNADRQSLPTPAASTIVNASTASTAQARKTVIKRALLFTAPCP